MSKLDGVATRGERGKGDWPLLLSLPELDGKEGDSHMELQGISCNPGVAGDPEEPGVDVMGDPALIAEPCLKMVLED